MPRKTYLQMAEEVTLQSRQKEYGHPLVNFLRIALLWSTYKEQVFTPYDVAMMMDLSKSAREVQMFKEDNLVDKIGYVSCLDRMITYVEEKGFALPGTGAALLRSMGVAEMWEMLMRVKDEA